MREEEKLRDVTLVREDQGGCGAHWVILTIASTIIMRVKLKNPRRRGEENKVPRYLAPWMFGGLTKIVTVDVGRWGVGREVVGSPKHGTVEVVEVGSPKHGVVEVVEVGSPKHETAEVVEVGSLKHETMEEEVDSPKHGTVRRKRKGGKGSRFRGLLAYQHRLSADRGLPPSRLMQETEARSPRRRGRREQEESASPTLRGRVMVVEEGRNGEVEARDGEEEWEEEWEGEGEGRVGEGGVWDEVGEEWGKGGAEPGRECLQLLKTHRSCSHL